MRSQVARNRASATKTRNLRRLLLAAMEEAAQKDPTGVGARIREARMAMGLTQDELADLVGIGMRQIQYYEAGDSNPYRTLRRIAEVTGKPLSFFLAGTPEPAEDPETLALTRQILDELRALREAVQRLVDPPTQSDTPQERDVSG
jgi:transcriptional regulator with XRE-family HTH domain